MSQTFNSGRSVELNLVGQKPVQAYDATLRFNRIIDSRNNDPSATIYSIDPTAFLKLLENDQLADLFKITLAARPARNGVGIWDVLFNSASHQGLTACILVADNHGRTIPQPRVVVTSQFLDFRMRTSRVALNQVEIGDRIGITVNDMARGTIYVLLYVIEDLCMIPSPVMDVDGRPSLMPAVNVKMEHAIRVNHDGTTSLAEMEEGNSFDPEILQNFVQWMVNTVNDVPVSYPFKPHFVSINNPSVKRDVLETRLKDDIERATAISYDDFEIMCREAYHQAKPPRSTGQQNNGRGRKGNGRGRTPNTQPILEAVQARNSLYVKLSADCNPDNTVFRLDIQEVQDRAVTEIFLANRDLEGILIGESNKILVLSKDPFGHDAYVRYLSLNF